MYSEKTIWVKNVGKCYQIYNKPHERLLQSLFRGKKTFYKDFWALRNISFSVEPGETVGIVGRNGSGKTTLLQLICGTLLPTQGACEVNGRVAALLALGAGFNQEYTGEENIQLYASLLGLSDKQISEQFNNICDFADIGEFISQPVKQYSSGMYMRLAFATAVHTYPDVMIVDEALAVGDEAFQRKCYARLEELKKGGMSLLFVSHSAGAVVNLCDRALLLEKGRLIASGQPKAIIASYHKLLFSPVSKIDKVIREIQENHNLPENRVMHQPDRKQIEPIKQKSYYLEAMQSKSIIYYEEKGAKISNPFITTPEGKQVNVLCKGERYFYTYTVTFTKECQRVRFGMMIKTITGQEIAGFATSSIQNPIERVANGSDYHVTFSFECRLNPGVYFLNAGVKGMDGSEETYLHRIIDAVMLRVMPEDEQRSTGIVDLEIVTSVQAFQSNWSDKNGNVKLNN